MSKTRSIKEDLDKQVVKAVMMARKPVMLVGPPGVGKTFFIYEMAEELGYDLITIIGSHMDNTDMTGLPKGEEVISAQKSSDGSPVFGTVYLSPAWQIKVLTKKKVIIFLDEFSNTPPSVQATMLTLLQERLLPNGQYLPPETIVIGAMNPAEQAADGYELSLPTANRLTFISWMPDHGTWCEGMKTAWGKEVSDDELEWKRKIAKFIEEQPGFAHKMPDDTSSNLGDKNLSAYEINDNDKSQLEVYRSAWPSYRSWDNLSQILPFLPNADVYSQDKIAQGTVGFSAAAAFRDWLRKNGNIDPKAVLKDPYSYDWTTSSLDDSNMILRSIIGNMNSENSFAALKVFDAIHKQGMHNLAGPYMQEFIKNGVGAFKDDNAKKTKFKNEAKDVAKLFHELNRKDK